MKVTELTKGTVYAWRAGIGHGDIRRPSDFIQVAYLGPSVAEYDPFRPGKKLNPGEVRVRMLQPGLHKRQQKPEGTEIDISAKEIVLSWAELEARSGALSKKLQDARQYLTDLRALVVELDPSVKVSDQDRWYHRGDDAGKLISVSLYMGQDENLEFDPGSSSVTMPVELFRKLLQGVKV